MFIGYTCGRNDWKDVLPTVKIKIMTVASSCERFTSIFRYWQKLQFDPWQSTCKINFKARLKILAGFLNV